VFFGKTVALCMIAFLSSTCLTLVLVFEEYKFGFKIAS